MSETHLQGISDRVKALILEEDSKGDKSDWSGIVHYICTEKYHVLLNAGSQAIPSINEVESQTQTQSQTSLQVLIANLQEHQFTIAVTLLLAIQSENLPSQCTAVFVSQSKSLFSKVNIQLQVVHKKAFKVCEYLMKLCSSSSTSARSIVSTLQLASQSLQVRDGVLHAGHAYLLHACVIGELYDFGYRFFTSHSALEIEPNSAYIAPADYLCYYYYGGLWYVYILL